MLLGQEGRPGLSSPWCDAEVFQPQLHSQCTHLSGERSKWLCSKPWPLAVLTSPQGAWLLLGFGPDSTRRSWCSSSRMWHWYQIHPGFGSLGVDSGVYPDTCSDPWENPADTFIECWKLPRYLLKEAVTARAHGRGSRGRVGCTYGAVR